MPNILLTGAGFSRNWGGWLANEAFEYLLGVDGLNPRVRGMLWEWMPPGFYTPDDAPFTIRERFQPYFKLHGSSNWAASNEGKLMLILGGAKEIEIPKYPLLAWYFSEFERHIAGNQLVIIGYSFSDEHINKQLDAAASRGTRMFIIDPSGVDVLDKRENAQILQPRSAFMDSMMACIDGASRRDLKSTLLSDGIERTKLYHFMTASERKRV
jgi:hypothetical protein